MLKKYWNQIYIYRFISIVMSNLCRFCIMAAILDFRALERGKNDTLFFLMFISYSDRIRQLFAFTRIFISWQMSLQCKMNEFGQTDAKISVMADLICIITHMQIAGYSRQWSNQNHWPWKPRCRHHNLSFILYNIRVMTQKSNFGNGWPNLHITQFPQGY